MSADNGVYIAKFPLINGGFEYRVGYASAIDNVDFGEDKQIQDVYRVLVWGESPSFSEESKAVEEAHRIAKEWEGDPDNGEYGYSFLEYGVQQLEPFDRPLPSMTRSEAVKKLDEF